MDKKQNSNVGTILANMEKSFFISKAYWIPVFPASARTGMTNTGVLQLAHYYKIILFSSFFWAIASFASSSFAMESNDVDVHYTSPAQGIPTEDLRRKKIRILQKAISDCDQFMAFEEDFLETCQNQSKFNINLEGIAHNIEAIKKVKYFLINYNKKGKDEEFLLSNFLELRLLLLSSRAEMIEKDDDISKKRRAGLLPSDTPSLLYGYTNPELFHQLCPEEQLFARTSTDRYQFFNQMILHVWQLVNPRTLRPNTKLKIRASTTLWDNLTGRREYLGHPDEAIFEYTGNARNDVTWGNDYMNYITYIKEYKIDDIPLLGWNKGKLTSISTTSYSRSLWHEDWSLYNKIKELPYPEWLKPLPNKDVVEITQKPLITPPVQKAPKMPRFKSPIQVIEVPTVAEEKQEPILESPVPQILEISRPISPVPVKNDTPVALKEEPEDKIAAPVVDENENTKVTTTLPSEPPRPRGMRLFHNESASSQQNTKASPLKGSHQLVHQQIFDQQQFKKVTYGQFKALWKHICGPNSVVESTGSSHKKLIAPNKEVFGTFAHSDSMTYSHRTIGYIRDALTQIGYGN